MHHMPKASIIVPAFNVGDTLAETLASLSVQTFTDFEIIVVDDGSHDQTAAIALGHGDPRLRLVRQTNRGLAGARNSGIAHARGTFIGFCDADDLWMPDKLAAHVAHLESNPLVGLSYSGSALIDAQSRPMGMFQTPRLRGVTPQHVFKRNPVGNGSAAVLRRAALDDIAWRPAQEQARDWWFDESFRQSEDIECWLRLVLSTDWQIEGLSGALTLYRINSAGLSSNTEAQLASWERMVAKLTPFNPAFFATHSPAARAYQLRYLSRRAISAHDRSTAWEFSYQSLRSSFKPVVEEPFKSLVTIGAAAMLAVFGPSALNRAQSLLTREPTV
jgi:glycosyltransferase involved in cell wall biosynthesis